MSEQATLFKKMAEVLETVHGIKRNGHAEVKKEGKLQYAYDYILESDLMEAVRPELAKRGVAVFYSDEILGREENAVTVRVSLTFADGETGAFWTCHGDAEATDYGDKAASKAKTTAMRYLLWKNFLVPSDIDPEQENVERGKSQARDGKITKPQIGALKGIFASLDKLQAQEPGFWEAKTKDAAARKFGHAVESLTHLTKNEASTIIDGLKKLEESEREAAKDGDFPPTDGDVDTSDFVPAGAKDAEDIEF